MDAHDAFASNLPPFLPPLSPTTPITPYNPPNSPPQTNKLFEAPRQNGATTGNNNQMLCKGSFPPQPSISKATPLASRADRDRHLSSGSISWIKEYRPSDLYVTSPSIVRRTAPTGWPSTATASNLHRAVASNPLATTTISHRELTSFCSR